MHLESKLQYIVRVFVAVDCLRTHELLILKLVCTSNLLMAIEKLQRYLKLGILSIISKGIQRDHGLLIDALVSLKSLNQSVFHCKR